MRFLWIWNLVDKVSELVDKPWDLVDTFRGLVDTSLFIRKSRLFPKEKNDWIIQSFYKSKLIKLSGMM